MKEVEVVRECQVYGIGPDTPPDEEDARSKSVGSKERRKLSPSNRMKFTFRSPKGKSPIRTPEWRDMFALDLDDEPFMRVQEELDRVSNQYSKMEVVIKGASKLLGDCKAGNIVKELKKFKEKDTESLEAANWKLQQEVDELKIALALKEDEVKNFKTLRMEALKEIWEIVGHPGDILNKAKLFDEYINKEEKITMPKVIAILHGFYKKMEAALGEIWKLVFGSVGESSRPPLPTQKETPIKEKPLDEVKTPLPLRPGKEVVPEGSGKVPAAECPVSKPPTVPVSKSQPIPEVALEPKTGKMKSLTPSPRKVSLCKPKEPIPEVEELRDTIEDTVSIGDTETEEEEEPSMPAPDHPKGRETRSSGRKKPGPLYRSPFASKR